MRYIGFFSLCSCLLPLASCLLPLASCLLPTPYSLPGALINVYRWN
ncbi:MAG: hypothetical protein F6J98_22320 [Moorea sp. SIO4G2]|nr:hypothetical protein [Moorena sp. SIO4G2]